MFDIWQPEDKILAEKIAIFQRENCNEQLHPDKIKVDTCNICPYESYQFVRLTYTEQRVIVNSQSGGSKRHEINTGTISYLLIKLKDDQLEDVIPLHSNSENLYAINDQLSLKLTSETVVSYLVFYGLVVNGDEGPFFMVSDLNHIGTILGNLSDEARNTLEGIIRGSFKIGNSQKLLIDVDKKSYPLLGAAFKVTIPVIYAGKAFIAKFRVSEFGIPAMDEDDPTTVEGLDDEMPVSKRYPLEFSPRTGYEIHKTKAKLDSKIKFINATLTAERAMSILLLPAYIMSITIILGLGFDQGDLYQYYDAIKSLSFLSWANLIVGFLLLLAVLFRFLIFEVLAATEKLVPSKLSYYFLTLTNHLKTAKTRLGLVPFMLLATLEFMAGTFLALNLFIYGVSNAITVSYLSNGMNFIEALLLIVFSVPFVGTGIEWIYGLENSLGSYNIKRDEILAYVSSGVITTVTIGLLVRYFRIIAKTD